MSRTIDPRRRPLTFFLPWPLLLLAAGCGRTPPATAPDHDPGGISLVFIPPRHDLGDLPNVDARRVVDVPTTIRNEGPRPVTIERLVASCSCTASDLGGAVIAPGAEVVLNTRIHVGHDAEARSSRVSVVARDAEDRAARDIEFTWRAVNPLMTRPESCTFEAPLETFGSAARELTLLGRGLALCGGCEIGLHPGSPAITAAFEALEPGRVRDHSPDRGRDATPTPLGTIAVSVRAGSEPRVHREGLSVVLACGGRELGRLALRVSWATEAALSVVPSTFALGFQAPGAKLRRSLLIRSSDGEAFGLTRIGLEAGEATLRADHGGRRAAVHKVDLEIELPGAAGPWRDHLLVETDGERAPTLSLPISAILREAGDDSGDSADEAGLHAH